MNDIISRGQVKVTETGDFNGYPVSIAIPYKILIFEYLGSISEWTNESECGRNSITGGQCYGNFSFTINFSIKNFKEEIVIPHDKCGIVIGKNGNTLRNLRSQFGCSVNLDSTVNSGARFRTVNRFREVNQQPSELLIMIHFN